MTVFPGQDPAALLNKYTGRFKLMHLKDLRKGIVGNLSGGTPVENDVALGTGQIDLPAVLKAAQKAGVQHYYIEDESPSVGHAGSAECCLPKTVEPVSVGLFCWHRPTYQDVNE